MTTNETMTVWIVSVDISGADIKHGAGTTMELPCRPVVGDRFRIDGDDWKVRDVRFELVGLFTHVTVEVVRV